MNARREILLMGCPSVQNRIVLRFPIDDHIGAEGSILGMLALAAWLVALCHRRITAAQRMKKYKRVSGKCVDALESFRSEFVRLHIIYGSWRACIRK
jgi:hypothetical protein